jgi:hypothetical protein
VKNRSGFAYAFVSGSVGFYDSAGIRCGEGVFKADVLAADEAFETDMPGLRIRCQAVSWRVVATNLLPRMAPNQPISVLTRAPANLVISIKSCKSCKNALHRKSPLQDLHGFVQSLI